MSIELDTSRLSTAFQSVAGETPSGAGVKKAAAALLGGTAVTVTNGAATDLEALVAKLKNENERAKFSVLLSSLSAIGQSLTDAQKRILEQGLALSEKLDELNETIGKYTGDEAQQKADSAILQAKIDALQKQIDQAIADGKAHNELVAEQKRVREELDAKKQVLAETQGQIAKTQNEISSVKGQISAIVKSIGENAVKAIANELATLSEPEKAERPAEAAKEAEKEAETNPFASIRDSLDRIERDIAATIEENRVENV
ncbi:MAG: hypothetical protein IJ783_06560 [Kiritimatiellae bacterium]|nr:hypothetical protein [Kiritimatiellia bacterium]